MKKLLVLTLVLGIASLATATLTFDISDLDDISVVGDGTTIGLPCYILITGTLVVDASNAVSLPGTFTGFDPGELEDIVYDAIEWDQAASGDTELFADLVIPGNPKPALPDGQVVLSGIEYVSGAGYIQLLTEDEYFDTQNYFAQVFIPEPSTLALLGLGALVLRRRK